MTPKQAMKLTNELREIRRELRSIRGFLEETADRVIVALSRVQ